MNSSLSFLDVETTTHNKGHRFDPRNKLVSFVLNNQFFYYSDPVFRNVCPTSGVIVGFNVKFDLHWMDVRLDDIQIWDCQLAEFVLSGQQLPYQSLDECLESYGLPPKKKHEVHAMWEAGIQTDEIPVPVLKEYNLGDVEPLKLLYQFQQSRCSPLQKRLIFLMGEDMKVLMEMERNGILFDKGRALEKVSSLKVEIQKAEEELSSFLPTIQHGIFNWDSGDHLSAFLYSGTISFDWFTETDAVYKTGAKAGQEYKKRSWFVEDVFFQGYFKPLENTEVKKTLGKVDVQTRFYQVDEPTLKQLKCPKKENKRIITLLLERSGKIKLVEMLESLFKQFDKYQWEHNLIHPNYNQNVVVTGRLSSSSPNMQNQPPEIDEFFISRFH